MRNRKFNGQMEIALSTLGSTIGYRLSALPNPTDWAIAEIVEFYVRGNQRQRARFTDALDKQAASALLSFAERMSMVSVWEQSTKHLLNALIATMMVEGILPEKHIHAVQTLIYNSAEQIDLQPRVIFLQAARYAQNDDIANDVVKFLYQSQERRSLQHAGYLTHEGQKGMVYWRGHPSYIPSGWTG